MSCRVSTRTGSLYNRRILGLAVAILFVTSILQLYGAELVFEALAGEGDHTTKGVLLPVGTYTFRMKHSSGRGSFKVSLLDESENLVRVLVEAKGSTMVSNKIKIAKEANYVVRILADGEWEMNIQQEDVAKIVKTTPGITLSLAKDNYDNSSEVAMRTLVKSIDKIFKSHITKGDLEKAVTIKEWKQQLSEGHFITLRSMKTALDKDIKWGNIPPTLEKSIKTYLASIVRIAPKMIKAYDVAIKGYTQTEALDKALKIKEEKENFIKTILIKDSGAASTGKDGKGTLKRQPRRPSYVHKDAVYWDSNWYWFPSTRATLHEAARIARKRRGRLLLISSKEENAFVTGKLLGASAWLAISDAKKEGEWLAYDKYKLTYSNWHTGEPNNRGSRGAEHYAVITKNGGWYDVDAHNSVRTNFCVEWGKEI